MATLYNGNKVVALGSIKEIIKEVPTEQDLTLLGNQMRRAYAYTNETDVSNQYIFTNRFVSPVITSAAKTATNISFRGYSSSVSYCIMDGTLYTIAADGTFTQTGTNYVKYCGNTIVTTTKAGSLDISPGDVVCGHSNYYFIVNGSLYRGTSLVDNTGTWTDVADSASGGSNAIGIRDNVIMVIRASDNAIKRVASLTEMSQISHWHYSNSHTMVANSNTVFYYSNGLTYANADTATPTTVTYESPIKKINPNMVLLTNGNLYYVPNNTLIDTNVLDICDTLQVYGKSNGIYFATSSGINVPTFNKIYSYGSNCILDTNYCSSGNNYSFMFKTNNNAIQETTIFSVNGENTAYSDIENLNSHVNITSKTDLKIVADSKDYLRDSAKDGIFKFIPPELKTHVFSDQELCQAYLNGGLQQNNS